ncbi:hypothetical protein [Cupriavidus gilardii]|uniref:Uncharacterized protein n=2 Tax=Pseudomonadota TaxID=1224 RepID=A0A849B845_9BURK|nr:hypothetical protein [Cupriavidus gilardii]KAB0597548.1 hypothetical protein F7Q96_09240 [Cupriavidus gilardii]MCT9014532.1 hypothetical protein [Cupriavidus gilardii]MCT9054252.1 hypothetical protein [Cupriavidus gilardii]NNH10093.1 hypothetical protein [Cupriavidus gilardii]WNG68339.1 hypothetical protein QWJ31_02335 [Cupriavidus gilardii]
MQNSPTRAERIIPLISHIAQIGLFIFTGLGFYFTVIPLYQKAAVDEQLAKQQHALAIIEAQLKEQYVKLRNRAISQYIAIAGPECTALLTPPIEIGSVPPSRDFYDIALETDMNACLQEALQRSAIASELDKKDVATIAQAVAGIASELTDSQRAARLRIQRIHALKGPLATTQSEDLAIATMKALGASSEDIARARSNFAYQRQRAEIGNKYLKTVTDALVELRNLEFGT